MRGRDANTKGTAGEGEQDEVVADLVVVGPPLRQRDPRTSHFRPGLRRASGRSVRTRRAGRRSRSCSPGNVATVWLAATCTSPGHVKTLTWAATAFTRSRGTSEPLLLIRIVARRTPVDRSGVAKPTEGSGCRGGPPVGSSSSHPAANDPANTASNPAPTLAIISPARSQHDHRHRHQRHDDRHR